MQDPWGVSGPEFIRLYLVGLAVAALFALVVRQFVRSSGKRSGQGAGAISQPLTSNEVAYLAGGSARVAEAAVARLIGAGLLHPSRGGDVSAVGDAGGAGVADAVDRTVLTDVTRFGRRSIRVLVDRTRRSDAVRAVGVGLADKGLLVEESSARGRAWIGVLPILALFAAGVVRWANGLSEDRPVGWLSVLLVLTMVVAWVAWSRLRKPAGRATRRGTEALRGAARDGADPVALRGFGAYPDPAVRGVLVPAGSPRGRRGPLGGRAAGAGAGYGAGYGVYTATSCASTSSCGSSASSCSSSSSSCGGGGGCGG